MKIKQEKQKVLIVGSGVIGAYLSKLLLSKKKHVIVSTRQKAGYQKNYQYLKIHKMPNSECKKRKYLHRHHYKQNHAPYFFNISRKWYHIYLSVYLLWFIYIYNIYKVRINMGYYDEYDTI